jgi:hypothetical protein
MISHPEGAVKVPLIDASDWTIKPRFVVNVRKSFWVGCLFIPAGLIFVWCGSAGRTLCYSFVVVAIGPWMQQNC